MADERRKVKGNEERERYTQMSAEFQRIARRDKKVFLNKHYKELEDNDRMGISFPFSLAFCFFSFLNYL